MEDISEFDGVALPYYCVFRYPLNQSMHNLNNPAFVIIRKQARKMYLFLKCKYSHSVFTALVHKSLHAPALYKNGDLCLLQAKVKCLTTRLYDSSGHKIRYIRFKIECH